MIDLTEKHQSIVEDILRRYIPDYQVWAFGFRVTGKAKQYSDLDLAIISDKPLDFGLLGEIRGAFSESDLPFKVDLIDWSATSREFQGIIRKSFVVIQKAQ